jgi:hypothetical protein
MRTAVISDLHLGLVSGGDVLRDAAVRAALLAEIGDADRVVLLGDVVELRELPLGAALERSRPFFEDLGAALGDREVLIVPGNHDHRLAEPLLDELSVADAAVGKVAAADAAVGKIAAADAAVTATGGAAASEAAYPGTTPPARLDDARTSLELEQVAGPSPGPTAAIDTWLGNASLRIAYPGIWLREDVYATHGHYMDAHLNLPRAECLALATMARLSRPIPAQATAADYERLVRPLYGFFFGVAQAQRRSAPVRSRAAASEAAWEVLAGERTGTGQAQRLRLAAARAGFPLGVNAVNRLLRSNFDADVSAKAIFQGGVDAAAEVARRLGVDGAHVITGHSHRGGPTEGEGPWPLAGGGSLHNTGSWVFSSLFHHPGTPPNAYWPGTVTWVEDSGPPRRVQLLLEHSHERMTALLSPATRR